MALNEFGDPLAAAPEEANEFGDPLAGEPNEFGDMPSLQLNEFGDPPAGGTPLPQEQLPQPQPRLGGVTLPQEGPTPIAVPSRFGFSRPEDLSPEEIIANKFSDAFIDRISRETVAYDEKFGVMERLSIREGKGNTRGTATVMLREMTKLQGAIADLQNEDARALERLKVAKSPKGALGPALTTEQIEDSIKALQERYDAIEKEYQFVAEVVLNPTSSRLGGPARDVPEHPVMLGIQLATQLDKPELVNRVIREFFIETLAEVAIPSMTQAGWSQLLVPGGMAVAFKGFLGTTSAARVGFVLGGGIVANQVESDAAFSEFLQEQGVDITDTAAIANALSDSELVSKGLTFAKRRGLSVAMWQMASFYLASKTIMPPGLTNKFAQKIFNVTAQATQQVATEAAGEFQAQVVSGQEISGTDIKLEAIGGFQGAVTEPIVFYFADRFGGKPTDYATVEKVLEAFIKNPEMTVQEALIALQEVAARGTTEEEAIALLESIPGVSLDTKTILSDRQHTDMRNGMMKGFEESPIVRKVLRTTVYSTTSGELLDGNEILNKAENTGTVYWSTGELNKGEKSLDVGSLSGAIQALDNLLTEAEAELNVALAQGGISSTQLNIISDEIEMIKEKKAQTQRDAKIMGDLRPQLHKLLQEMVTLFMPNQDIMVIEDDAVRDSLTSKVAGATNVSRSTITGKETQLLYLNTQALLDLTEIDRVNQRQGTGKPRNFAAIASVMAHEFGHTLAMTWFNKLPAIVREALQAEHRNWLANVLSENKEKSIMAEILKSKVNLTEQRHFDPNFFNDRTLEKMAKSKKHKKTLQYHLSFTEFVADLMARQLQDKKSAIVAPLTKKFLPRLQTLMRRYFAMYKDQGVFPADETYGVFLQLLKSNAHVQQIEEIKSQFTMGELASPAGGQAENVFNLLSSKELNIPQEVQDEVMADLDTYNLLMRYGITILQLGQENKHIPGLMKYIRAVHEHWITKSNWNDQAMQTLNAWRKLGKTGDELGRFLIEMTVKSDELKRALTNDEIDALLKEKKIDFGAKAPEAWKVYERVKGDLANSLQELYLIEKQRINEDWAGIKSIREAKINELDKLFTKLRDRNYFPLSRFGTLGITVKAIEPVTIAGRGYAKGEVIHMELYENKRQRNKGIGTLRRKYGPKTLSTFFAVDEDMKPFTGLPIAVMRQLKNNDKLRLTPEQKIKLQDMIDVMSPTQSIAKRMLERKGTAGFSHDAQRGYGNYMLMMGGHIAKMRHVGEMDAAIDSVKKSATYLGQRGIINDKRNEIAGHLVRHQDYLLNPVNEWGNMRALAFVWFLGYNVKSAIVNLTQVPLVAYPYLAARAALTGGTSIKSDAVAIAALTKAGVDVGNFFRKGINKYSIDEQEMLSILQAEGIIDESLATELAGIAHGDQLARYMPRESAVLTKGQRGVERAIRYSTVMFQAAEKYNRRVVALATYRLARAKDMNTKTSIDEAREAIRVTQFEYARWNRAAFMRGKAGILFVFQQYVQNILYFVTRDPGRARYMMMMLLAGGLQGLPGAEDIMDTLDLLGDKAKKWTKSKRDPRTDIREWLRNLIISLHASPELLMHGASAQSFGLGIGAVNDMLGTSMASLSFEASISMGNIVPGWEALMKFMRGMPVGQSGQIATAKDILGAAITVPINILQWTMDPDPSSLRAFERMAPSVIKGGTRAFRIATGANEEGISTLTNRQGQTIADFDMNDPEHIAELLGMALGAQPTKVLRVQEAKWAEKEALQFYAAMRRNLQINFNYAMEEKRKVGDTEAVKDARKKIKQYNSIAPKGQQLINYPAAYFQYKMGIEKDKRGVGDRLFDQPVRDDIQKSFPAATEERIK